MRTLVLQTVDRFLNEPAFAVSLIVAVLSYLTTAELGLSETLTGVLVAVNSVLGGAVVRQLVTPTGPDIDYTEGE